MGTPTDLVGTSEAARILDVDVSTVNRWAVEGRLRVAHRLAGPRGARLYAREDVDAFARELADQRPPRCPTCGHRMERAAADDEPDEPEPNGATQVA